MAKKAKQAEHSVNEWGGQKHYMCGSCSFDTFHWNEMLKHLVDAHDSEAALAELLSIEEEVKNGANNPGKDHS